MSVDINSFGDKKNVFDRLDDLKDKIGDKGFKEVVSRMQNIDKMLEEDAKSAGASLLEECGGSEGVTEEVVGDLVDWLSNKTKLPSDGVSKFLKNSEEKTEFSLYFIVLANLARIKKLLDFIRTAEDRIFKLEDIETMDDSELMYKYNSAVKRLDTIYEQNRQIVLQAKKKTSDDDEITKAKLLIGSLSIEQIKGVLGKLSNK